MKGIPESKEEQSKRNK